MPTGQFRLSRIIYFTDMQHSDAPEFGIGYVGEIRLPAIRAIGIAVRPHFSSEQLERIGPLARKILAKPIDALWPEYKEIFEANKSSALDIFSSRHASALTVFAPEHLSVPRQWLLEQNYDDIKTSVLERLKVTLVDKYYEFLFPPRGPTIDKPSFDETIWEKAAA